MYRISGPVCVFAIQHKGTNILLFGDIHDGNEGLCADCSSRNSCIDITDFLGRISQPVDIFLESQWVSKQDRALALPPNEKDTITKIAKNFHSNMYKHVGQGDGRRVHYTEIRTDDNFNAIMHLQQMMFMLAFEKGAKLSEIDLLLLGNLSSIKKIARFINIVVKSNDYENDVSNLFSKTVASQLINIKSLTHRPNDITHRLPKIHKVRKQLLKLTSGYRKAIMRFHKERCSELLHETSDYDNSVANIMKMKRIDAEDALYILHGLLLWFSHLKDMYTLCRVLYYIDKTGTVVTYDGADHTQTYKRFFTNYLEDTKLIHQHNMSKKKKALRCVSLPYKYVQHITNRGS